MNTSLYTAPDLVPQESGVFVVRRQPVRECGGLLENSVGIYLHTHTHTLTQEDAEHSYYEGYSSLHLAPTLEAIWVTR